jgi:hypothetical protein
MKAKHLAIINSYARSAFVCLATIYVTNPDISPSELWKAFAVAFIAPILRALNPDDTQFGIGAPKE